MLLPFTFYKCKYKCKGCDKWHFLGPIYWWRVFKERFDYGKAHLEASNDFKVTKQRIKDKFKI